MKKKEVEKKGSTLFNKKAIRNIAILVICGIITGLVLSNFFIDEANRIILDNDQSGRLDRYPDVDYEPKPLTTEDIIYPSFGVIIVCICIYLLIGILYAYILIYRKTKSPYILGLLFFFTPILIQSIYSLNTIRSLYITPAIPFHFIQNRIGFHPMGLGGIIIIVTIFEIIGLSILLYLSSE